MLIENISHACLKFHFKNFSLLTDPWISKMPIKSFMIYKLPAQVEKSIKNISLNVKYCYISHTHEDHFHVPSLKKLNKDIHFLIPNFSKYNNFRRANVMYETLKKLGFKKITKLSPWQKKKLSSKINATLIPSAKTRYYDWENSGLAISYEGKTVLNMNDNVVDIDLLKKIKKKLGNIHMYFVQTAGISIFPACFSFSKQKKENLIKNKVNDFKLHKQIIDYLNPDYLIPYAGDFGWFGKHTDFNFLSRSTPLPLLNYLKRKKINTFEFNPSDKIILKNGLFNLEKNNIINWGNFEKLINKNKIIYKSETQKVEKILKKNLINGNFLNYSKKFIESLNQINATSNAYLNFNARISYCIREKYKNKKYFYILVKAEKGKNIQLELHKNKPKNIYQIHYLEKDVFSLVLKGLVMFNKLQWRTEIKQIKKFDKKNRDLLFFIGYHIDGDNRTPQVKIRKYYSVQI